MARLRRGLSLRRPGRSSRILRAVARVFAVSADNPFSVLAEIGGECAGAVAVGPVGGAPPGSASPAPRWLPEPELETLLDEMPQRPLVLLERIEEEDGIRISLAGAHDKTGVHSRDREIGLTAGRPPSTQQVLVERVRSSQEDVRRRLPAEFQDRAIIERIDSVIEKRARRLLKARAEDP